MSFGYVSTRSIANPTTKTRDDGEKSRKKSPSIWWESLLGSELKWMRIETPNNVTRSWQNHVQTSIISVIRATFTCAMSEQVSNDGWMRHSIYFFQPRFTWNFSVAFAAMFHATIWLWNESNDLDQSLLTYLFSFKLAWDVLILFFHLFCVSRQQLRFLI